MGQIENLEGGNVLENGRFNFRHSVTGHSEAVEVVEAFERSIFDAGDRILAHVESSEKSQGFNGFGHYFEVVIV